MQQTLTSSNSSSRTATRLRRANSSTPIADGSALWANTSWPHEHSCRYVLDALYSCKAEGDNPGCDSESSATSTPGGGRSPEHEEHEEQLECRAILMARSSCESLGISCEVGYKTFMVVGEAQQPGAAANDGRRCLRRRGATFMSGPRALIPVKFRAPGR